MPKAVNKKTHLLDLSESIMFDAPGDERWVKSIRDSISLLNQNVKSIHESGVDLFRDCKIEFQEIDVQAPDPWIRAGSSPAWLGGATNSIAPYDKSYFMKRDDGVVECRLFPDGCTAGTAFLTLPVGYRPVVQMAFATTNVLGQHTSINIATSGSVSCVALGAAGLDVLACFSFLASDSTPVPLSGWPKLIKTKFQNPIAVVVCGATDNETSLPLPCRAGVPVWESASQAGSNQVKLLNIPWLPYNRKVRVKLLIIGA